MKTAKEILIEWIGEDAVGNSLKEYAITEAMREYAIMHVEAALKSASKVPLVNYCNHCSGNYCECQPEVDNKSILTAYLLTNIK